MRFWLLILASLALFTAHALGLLPPMVTLHVLAAAFFVLLVFALAEVVRS